MGVPELASDAAIATTVPPTDAEVRSDGSTVENKGQPGLARYFLRLIALRSAPTLTPSTRYGKQC